MNGCLLCRRGWKFFFVEIAKKAFSIVFFLGVSNASDPVKPSSKRRKHRARTSRSNNNNSTGNNNSVENSIMFLEKFTGQYKCGNVRFSGRKLFYSFACHCDACRNAYEKQGKGFATPIEDVHDGQLRKRKFNRNASVRDEIVDGIRRREQDEV